MGKGEQTRAAIVDEALAQAHQVGLEGLSLGTLASSLGLSKSGLFAHFASKEALQLQVLEAAIDRFTAEVVTPALEKRRAVDRLRTLFDLYLEWIRGRNRESGCLFLALSVEYDDRPGPIRDRLVRSQRDWLDLISGLVADGKREGDLRRAVDPAQFALEFLGLAMAYQHTHKLMQDDEAFERSQRAFTDVLARSRRRRA